MLTFETLREVNVRRCETAFHAVNKWAPEMWACAVAGEAGEMCNAVKKLKRVTDGINTANDPQTEAEAVEAIGKELADTVIYADLLAARLGIDLGAAVVAKFNEVSARMGCTITLPNATELLVCPDKSCGR